MNRRSITLVIVVVLCAVAFAYGQGWLERSHTGNDINHNNDVRHPASNQEKTNEVVVPKTQQTADPGGQATK